MMTLKPNQATPARETVAAAGKPLSRWRNDEIAFTIFPKEFEKSLADIIDKRFFIILALTILVDCATIAYFLSNAPEKISERGTDHFRKKLAELMRDKIDVEREAKFVDPLAVKELPLETEASSAVSGRSSGGTGRRTRGGVASAEGGHSSGGAIAGGSSGYGGPVGANRRTREDISNAASRAGILGLLTSRSNQASGLAAEEVLGGNVPLGDIDKTLGNAGGLRRGSAIGPGGEAGGEGSGNGRELRGGRSTGAGGIDALVQGLGQGVAHGVQRSGGFEVGGTEPLIEETTDGKATGTRDRDAVAAIVAKHTAAIQYCYQRELKRSPNLKGKVVVRFVITPQGAVESVAILASTLGNSTVETCISERIKRWDDFGAIDPSKGNTTFRQVYTFGY